MDVLISETCWALYKEIIKQVTSSCSLFTQLSEEVSGCQEGLCSRELLILVYRRNWINFMWRAIVHYLTRAEVNVCVGLSDWNSVAFIWSRLKHWWPQTWWPDDDPSPCSISIQLRGYDLSYEVSLCTAKYHSCHRHCLVHGSVRLLTSDLKLTLSASQ